MAIIPIRVILNGVTGRMGTNQHLVRSILAIREQGGVVTASGDRIVPEPVLVGRNADKLRRLAAAHGVERWTTDLDSALADDENQIYFDALATNLRVENTLKAIAAGKAVYCEKPTAATTAEAVRLAQAARDAGVKNGVVQDKLFLPGLLKLKYLIDTGFFGRILSVRGEFGYWVFDGIDQPAQRPSWNYQKAESGGIILDMFAHWRYVIDNLFGPISSLACMGAVHLPDRVDERGERYAADADDAAYAIFELANGVVCQFNSSWTTRVRRDDLLTVHVDGTRGSAVAGLRECVVQGDAFTPKPVWNPDITQPIQFFDTWQWMPNNRLYDNAFKIQWEAFLRHVVEDTPFRWDLMEGAKGVQLAELGYQAWAERRWVDVPALGV
ncbi:MAG: Gfo/Idh/MocA family oxidoreductase [Caldilineaceae bacterium]|nr:Gfo/Idh/MocA family oxidoreductase [Caldilineaceae bacterium]